jgi:signal transduction histidine kinase
MVVNRLKWSALIAPIAAIVVLEIARVMMVGQVSLGRRLALDGIVLVVFAVFGIMTVRTIGSVHDRVRRQNRELIALQSAGNDVMSELALEIVLKKVVDRACDLVGARYGALSVIEEDGHTIRTFITSGVTDELRAAIGPPPVGHGVLGVSLHEGQRLRLGDVSKHPQSIGFPAHHPVMRSLVAVPITCRTPFIGNLYLADKTDAPEFSEADEETLARFAGQAAIAIDNAYLHQQVADLAVAQERLRIAHEMHDGIAQVLGYVNTKVQAANEYLRKGKTEDASAQLRELAVAARDAYTDVRESIVSLRTLPTTETNAAAVIEEYLDRWKEQTGISTQLTIEGDLRLPASVELQFVRIVQEAMANVRKHAKATAVKVDVRRRNARVHGTIVDDGIGFTPGVRVRSDFPRFGLTTMRERAESIGGKLAIESAPGRGTTVTFELPVV